MLQDGSGKRTSVRRSPPAWKRSSKSSHSRSEAVALGSSDDGGFSHSRGRSHRRRSRRGATCARGSPPPTWPTASRRYSTIEHSSRPTARHDSVGWRSCRRCSRLGPTGCDALPPFRSPPPLRSRPDRRDAFNMFNALGAIYAPRAAAHSGRSVGGSRGATIRYRGCVRRSRSPSSRPSHAAGRMRKRTSVRRALLRDDGPVGLTSPTRRWSRRADECRLAIPCLLNRWQHDSWLTSLVCASSALLVEAR
jgi:hypothetical protein